LETQITTAKTASTALKVGVIAQRFANATRTTDVRNGDNQPSPTARVVGNDGVYNVVVAKTASGNVSYTIDFHCLSRSEVHTLTNAVLLQNQ
jgi:hypothetical protein